MKTLMTVLSVCAAIGLAAPADADDDIDGDDLGFISAVHEIGVNFVDQNEAIGVGKAVCGCLNSGEAPLEMLHELKARNPGFTMEDATNFALVSAKFYCPHQLRKA